MEREDRSRLPFREQTRGVKVGIVIIGAVGVFCGALVLAVAGKLALDLVGQVLRWVF